MLLVCALLCCVQTLRTPTRFHNKCTQRYHCSHAENKNTFLITSIHKITHAHTCIRQNIFFDAETPETKALTSVQKYVNHLCACMCLHMYVYEFNRGCVGVLFLKENSTLNHLTILMWIVFTLLGSLFLFWCLFSLSITFDLLPHVHVFQTFSKGQPNLKLKYLLCCIAKMQSATRILSSPIDLLSTQSVSLSTMLTL